MLAGFVDGKLYLRKAHIREARMKRKKKTLCTDVTDLTVAVWTVELEVWWILNEYLKR